MTLYKVTSKAAALTACSVLESAGIAATYSPRVGGVFVSVSDDEEWRAVDIIREVDPGAVEH